MSEVAIRVEKLGKKYQLGTNKAADLRNAFGDFISKFKPSDPKNSGPQRQSYKDDFWALKDITFEVKKGEAIGIIGRNGAGKSTLLKILSRITEPTNGHFTLNGRVSSLLEVGTGFHMELTGRENIFLNGTILGMKRREIRKKFDEIVDFSGVEQFIDTPVKHYSSGMKVRLAFSVAAHLEPEILLIDEVLAVGDSEFQKKCLGKMEDVTQHGRTILFVSHNMTAIENLCESGILLENGTCIYNGNVSETVEKYIGQNDKTESQSIWEKNVSDLSKPLEIKYVSARIYGSQPNLKLNVETIIKSNQNHIDSFIAFDIHSEYGNPLFQSIPTNKLFIRYKKSPQKIITNIDLPSLIPGNYFLSVWIGPHYSHTYDWIKEIVSFEVRDTPIKDRIFPHSKRNGFLITFSEAKIK